MNTILIAGAGQLGSRHLQGVKSSNHELDIWVYDLSEESLKVAEERYNQVESGNKTAHFVTSLDTVPENIDIVIVASGSKPRAIIVKQILASKKVKYMVLEKFLFTRLAEYEEIGNLLNEKGVNTWVNCPRRMWDGYAQIKSWVNCDEPIEYTFEGGEWGMCCNTIHFADIFMYLNGCDTFEFSMDKVIPEVVDSKRPGYVELHGTEIFTTANGSKLSLTSLSDYNGDAHVVIKNAGNTIEYYEGKGIMLVNGIESTVPVHYQSGLSGTLINELLETGSCRLSTYEMSASYHVSYLSQVGPFINKLKGWTSDSCPIT